MVDIKEHITFAEFNSRDENLYLISRDAPSPSEYESVLSVPNRHGVLDFSNIDGERKFQNRKITYEFQIFKQPYSERKNIERKLKQQLMIGFDQKLRDTHDIGFYWLGKCNSVKVEDDAGFDTLVATIEFDVYPFMFQELEFFNDVWNDFKFETDVANFTAYDVSGEREIILINTGDTRVTPIIQVERRG